jgi:hypothetical protein
MNGEPKVLVSRASATHCRAWEDDYDHVCPLDRDHSDLVKFGPNDRDYALVLGLLRGLVSRAINAEKSGARAADN